MSVKSGLSVSDEAIKMFNDMKMKKKERYMLMKLNDDLSELVIEKVVHKEDATEQEEEYNELVNTLRKDESRFVVVDLDIPSKSQEGIKGGAKMTSEKLFLIMWNPEENVTKMKMAYAAALSTVQTKFKIENKQFVVQANDPSDLTYASLLERGK